jgi:asparagine synthase (glutamine-hydrolysing)
MCGLLFVVDDKIDVSKCDSALNSMVHRGPDFQDSKVINHNVFLGHNRLSILDLNPRSNQPFSRSNLHLIFNGEIYNYKELIQEHHLKVSTTSDTEVVLAMYEKYGANALNYFNGMFAFVIYNDKTNDTFIARDRLGIKPLYYYKHNNQIIYSSEINSIVELAGNELEYDAFGIRQYRKLRMTLKGYTLYQNIKMFPAGHYSLNNVKHQYWKLEVSEQAPPSDEELKWLIEDATMLRKRSDVPVGSYLSGGLDSTILSYILKPDDTWTVGFNELNEFEWGALANKGLHSNHHQILVSNDEFLSYLKDMIQIRKEPLSVPNEILIYLMTKKVKERNTVVLSGEGADELFWGYDRIFKWANSVNEFNLEGFDTHYSYGSHQDNEVLDFALENNPGKTVLEKVGYFFQIYHLHGLLRRLDNSTMLCSVEARVPFVDHRLVERLFGTPFDWKMGQSFKEPLKRIFKSLIPQEIIDRKKIGFPVPLDFVFENSKVPGNTSMDKWLNYNLLTLDENYFKQYLDKFEMNEIG